MVYVKRNTFHIKYQRIRKPLSFIYKTREDEKRTKHASSHRVRCRTSEEPPNANKLLMCFGAALIKQISCFINNSD